MAALEMTSFDRGAVVVVTVVVVPMLRLAVTKLFLPPLNDDLITIDDDDRLLLFVEIRRGCAAGDENEDRTDLDDDIGGALVRD